jgi:predicted nucleic-acid-binding protein
VRGLLQSECFRLDPASWKALELMAAYPKLDFTDCLLIARSRADADTGVLSFDRELLRAAEG